MRTWWSGAAVAVALAPAAWAQAPGAEPAQARDYGALPTVADLDLSADGAKLLLLAPQGDTLSVQLAQAGAGLRARRMLIAPEPDVDVIDAEWVDSRRILVMEKRTAPVQIMEGGPDRLDLFRTSIVDIETGARLPLLPERTIEGWDIISPLILGRVHPKPGFLRIATPEYRLRDILERRIPEGVEATRFAVFEINLSTGEGEIIEHGTPHTRAWAPDAAGNLRARIDIDPEKKTTEYWVRGNDQEPLRLLQRWPTILDVPWSIDGFDPTDVNFAYVSGDFGGDKVTIRRMDLRTGAIGPVFVEKPGVDVIGMLVETWTNTPVGYGWVDDRARQAYFEPAWAALMKKAEERFPNKTLSIPFESADRRLVIVRVSAPDDPPSAWLLSADGARVEHLYDEYPQLEGRAHGSVRYLTYAARDGVQIPAYLTIPPGAEAKNLPLIVMPHGGPSLRDEGDFDWWAQFLAARGYAVLQPNFRGSAGYGKAFERAGWQQWGGLMQDDVTDGVVAMISQGVADPKRVCIVGASYGGYAALKGAVKTPDLYACVASIAGVSDLNLLVQHDLNNVQSDPLSQTWLESAVAGDLTDKAVLDRASPARQAAQVRAPVLLIHGRDDTSVAFAHTIVMAEALEAAGKKVDVIELTGGDHYLYKAATRTAMLDALIRFLDANLKR